jgi:hypothetical protein
MNPIVGSAAPSKGSPACRTYANRLNSVHVQLSISEASTSANRQFAHRRQISPDQSAFTQPISYARMARICNSPALQIPPSTPRREASPAPGVSPAITLCLHTPPYAPSNYFRPFCRLIMSIGAQSLQSPAQRSYRPPTAGGNSFIVLYLRITPLFATDTAKPLPITR